MIEQPYLRPVWAEIDLRALTRNIRNLSAVAKGSEVMAVVKANAYGHGAVPCARAALLAGATRLGVALVEEGIELRREKIKAPILILNEPPVSAIPLILKYGLTPTVFTKDFAIKLSIAAQKAGRSQKCHLKTDTGMLRLGEDPNSSAKLLKEILNMPGIELEGVFTHFAVAERHDDPFTKEQFKRFLQFLELVPESIRCRHAANSAAAIFHKETHLNMVRIGLSMYGLYPCEEARKVVRLDPVLSLKARISLVKDVQAGQGVSYGLTFRAKAPTKVAVVPVGYGDGYFRSLSNKGEAIVRGQIVRVAGTVCMDLTMFDLGQDAKARRCDTIILIGAEKDLEVTADDIASKLGTINYEVVTAINKRVPRTYLNK